MAQQIIPNLWFDGNAQEAVDFYTTAFPDSKTLSTAYYPNSVEEGLADFQLDLAGKPLTIEFVLSGQRFTAINAGPDFQFSPAISFMVNFDPLRNDEAKTQLNTLWNTLVDGGEVLMPLDAYPFSKRYGWVKDRYGLTWQLLLTNSNGGEPRSFIVPSLMFSGKNVNHAREAVDYYLDVFKDSRAGNLAPYTEDTGPAKAGSLMYGDFKVLDQWFALMDSGVDNNFPFNESTSFVIMCRDQTEIDYYWQKLSTVPEAEQCGWCKDRFGLSWQIVPKNMDELMSKPDAFAKMMNMKKLVIADF